MKKYFYIIILLSASYSCKSPLNAINEKSFPDGSIFINYTDTSFYEVYKQNKIELTFLMVKLNEKNYDLIITNDSIEEIGLIQSLKDSRYKLKLYFYKGTITANSSVDTLQKINDLGIDFVNPKPLSFHKKGISYNAVLDSLNKWTFSYLSDKYTKFLNDTLETYYPHKYSMQFSTYSYNGGLSHDLSFLPLSIAYFSVNPDMMESWDQNARKNMDFLIMHQFDEIHTIVENIEKFVIENDFRSLQLCRLLHYIKQPNADDYRAAQRFFKNEKEYRWIDDYYLKNK